MALSTQITTVFGETRDVYVRLNNVEVSNHGEPARALFRAFISQAAFLAESHYVAELCAEFQPDVSGNLWEQAYVALKADPTLDGALDM